MIKPRANKDRVEVFTDKPGWEYQVFVDGKFHIGCDYEDDAEATKQRIIAVLDETVEMCCVLVNAKSKQLPAPNPGGRITAAIRRIMKPR